jgi:SWIM zinc finger
LNTFSIEQVQALAPDAGSLSAGKALASASKWLVLQYNDRVLWGEIKGSGSNPYRTQVDLTTTAFKCSCPSRKFPCKHGMGVLLLFAQNVGQFSKTDTEPDWVKEWIDKRAQKAEAKAAEPTEDKELSEKEQAAKDKAKAKRADEKAGRVEAGAAELELWLTDLLRGGILGMADKGSDFFSKMAARMVDAQAGGLAGRVRQFNKINFYGDPAAWHSATLANMADTFLLLQSFKNIEKLPPSVQEEVKSQIGFTQKKQELLDDPNADSVTDDWLVVTVQKELDTEIDLTIQRTWLYGLQSRRFALILDFAYKNAPIPLLFVPATVTKAVLHFFPSHFPQRAIVKTQGANSNNLTHAIQPLANYAAAQKDLAEILAKQPLMDDFPQIIWNLTPIRHEKGFYLRDTEGGILKVNTAFSEEQFYRLLALSGGKPLTFCLLRMGYEVLPLGAFEAGSFQYKTL